MKAYLLLYIPTYGRGDSQPVYDQLSAAGYGPVLVVDKRDPFDYRHFAHVRGEFKDLKSKEHALAMRHYKLRTPYMQFDDDLVVRKSHEGAKIKDMTLHDWEKLFALVDTLFTKGAAQVGIHHRTYVNFAPHPYTYNAGQFPFRIKAYNTAIWRQPPRPCPGVDGHNDVWMWHELISQGLDYATITDYCHVDRPYKPKRTHFEPEFSDKVKGFQALLNHMGIDRERFTRPNKHGSSLRYAKLAKFYRELPKARSAL